MPLNPRPSTSVCSLPSRLGAVLLHFDVWRSNRSRILGTAAAPNSPRETMLGLSDPSDPNHKDNASKSKPKHAVTRGPLLTTSLHCRGRRQCRLRTLADTRGEQTTRRHPIRDRPRWRVAAYAGLQEESSSRPHSLNRIEPAPKHSSRPTECSQAPRGRRTCNLPNMHRGRHRHVHVSPEAEATVPPLGDGAPVRSS